MQRGDIVAGKYRLNQPLGSGGMAEVWSATNTFTERQIAIKFMNAQVAKTPEAAARFLKEAKVSARVNHPNIIDVIDVGQTEQNQLFLVMELLTGFPLEVALRRQTPPMTLYEFSIVMIEVAEALSAAHKAGIVHRDLKPTNIYLHKVKEGVAVPKVLDFGVSKFLEDDTNHALTVAGTVLGTPLYMSPEQARGESNLDGRTDVFAFGAILFEALCGYRAYEAKNFNALIVKIATTKPKSIDACAPHVPDSLRRVVRACMETELRRRAQTFDDVIAMMRQAMPELEASSIRLPTPLIATAVVDPDATNALPVLRASDRPPAMIPHMGDTIPGMAPTASSGSISVIPPPPNNPSSDTWTAAHGSSPPSGSSWQTPNTSYASIVSVPKKRNPAWLLAAGAALVVGGIGIGAVVAARPRVEASAVSARAPESIAAPSPSPLGEPSSAARASDTPGADPPTVSVDSLPGAKSVTSLATGSGRLSLAASPGWCTISIDGKEHGPTPLAAVDLAAGPHQILCKPPTGKPRSASVVVQDGATSKYRFALED
ncbi:MAG: serine/threonine protein kinase [Labilithrix sp.]|nr:serine/threonine protein kinase [Labilithrix sp.]